MHANVARIDISVLKRFLDVEGKTLKIPQMKNLMRLGVLVALCGMLGSCGLPMAVVRTAANTPTTVSNMLTAVQGKNL